MGISGIWNNMVNFIHDFGYLGLGYMEFPLIWDILAGTNASLITGNVCTGKICLFIQLDLIIHGMDLSCGMHCIG